MSTAESPTPLLRLRDAYRFFIPLMLMAELMMISHAVIAAFLARMPDPEPILAAYSISFAVHATLGSPVWACQIVFLSFVRDRVAVRRLVGFGLQTVASVAWFWLALALTPMGDWFFVELFGVSPAVAAEAKICLLIGLLIPPTSVLRSLAYAMLMTERRTIWVTAGTVIRLLGLAGLLATLGQWYDGAIIGVLALAGCITIETVVAVIIAFPAYRRLVERKSAPPSYRELWRFSWPIMLMQTAESGVALTANFFLGRLARPELALAAFGVMDSIMRVLLSPLRNLIHTSQTLIKQREDARVVVIFALHLAGLFGGLTIALFNIPWLRELVLSKVMGLPPHMAEYITPALQVSVFLALCMAAAGLARGLLIASKNTKVIAVSSLLRIIAVFAVGAFAISYGADNGAMIGMLALTIAFGTEATYLAWQLLRLDRRQPRLFDKCTS